MRHVGTKRRFQKQTGCQIEPLEARQLMSGSTAPIVILGTNGPDNVEVHFVDYNDGHTGFRWTLNGVTYTRNDADPSDIQILTFSGNDSVKVTSTRAGQNLDIDTGSDDDVVELGNFNGPAFDYKSFGNVFVQMGYGKDYFDIFSNTSSTPDINNVYTFASDHANAGGTSKATGQPIGGATVNYQNADVIQWYGPDQATRWKINSVHAGNDFTPFGGSGNDEFDVGAGSLDANILGSLHIKDGNGTDGVMFLDYNDTGADIYTLTYNKLVKSAYPNPYLSIDYTGENVFLYANKDGNQINVENAMPFQHFYLYGDGGSNNFFMAPSTQQLASLSYAQIYVTGGLGYNTMTLVDHTQKQTASYTLTDAYFYKFAGTVIQYAGLSWVQLRFAGPGNDHVYLKPSRRAGYDLVDESGAGAHDQLNLSNLHGVKNPTFNAAGQEYDFANRKPITIHGFASYPTTFASNTAISGQVFKDVNGDGQMNNTDSGLANRTVYIDLNNNGVLDVGEDSLWTDQYGKFSFTGFMPGTYVIRQILPQGAYQTSPSPGKGISVTVGNNQKIGGLMFGSQSF